MKKIMFCLILATFIISSLNAKESKQALKIKAIDFIKNSPYYNSMFNMNFDEFTQNKLDFETNGLFCGESYLATEAPQKGLDTFIYFIPPFVQSWTSLKESKGKYTSMDNKLWSTMNKEQQLLVYYLAKLYFENPKEFIKLYSKNEAQFNAGPVPFPYRMIHYILFLLKAKNSSDISRQVASFIAPGLKYPMCFL
jgi:hypothetical protein